MSPDGRRRRLLLASAALTVSLPSAASHPLRILAPDDGEQSREVVRELARRHPGSGRVETAAGSGSPIIGLGPNALRMTLATRLEAPYLQLFVASATYRELAGDRGPSAIHAETSPWSQMQVVRALYGRRAVAMVLTTPRSAAQLALLRAAADEFGVQLAAETLEEGEHPTRSLARLTGDVLVALPDPGIYRSDTLRPLLEATYRRGAGLIGFSDSMVRAGAIAAPIARVDDVLDHADELLEEPQARRVEYPRFWRVEYNMMVARSLGIRIDASDRALGRAGRTRR
jgi:putative ABC transport system substrate-binding protein